MKENDGDDGKMDKQFGLEELAPDGGDKAKQKKKKNKKKEKAKKAVRKPVEDSDEEEEGGEEPAPKQLPRVSAKQLRESLTPNDNFLVPLGPSNKASSSNRWLFRYV